MADFMVKLNGARPQNGHAGDGPISAEVVVEADDWHDAREKTARRFHVAVFDPAMLAVRAADLAPPVLEEPAPSSRKRPRTKRAPSRKR